MCTPFAHSLAGYAAIILGEPQFSSTFRKNLHALGAGIAFGTLADADFLVAYNTRIPFLQHHYFSHSIAFVFVIGLIAYGGLKILMHSRALKFAMLLAAAYATHLLLDYFTHDGSPPIGIPLLWPFTSKHFIAPIEFFLSIHRGSMETLFGPHNFQALFREAVIVGPFALASYWIASRKWKVESGKWKQEEKRS